MGLISRVSSRTYRNFKKMRVVVQKVQKASVSVDNKLISKIDNGLCVLFGINRNDDISYVEPIIKKVLTMKLFQDSSGAHWKESLTLNNKPNGLELLLVSQFTLDAYFKGAKPDFHKAMGGEKAKSIFDHALATAAKLHPKGESHVKTGQFGAQMAVEIVNDGPVTIVYDYPQNVDKKGHEVSDNGVKSEKKEKKNKNKGQKQNPKIVGKSGDEKGDTNLEKVDEKMTNVTLSEN